MNTSTQNVPTSYDVIIIGAGHNGLVCAAYLAAAGKKVLVLERRHVVGGAAVTEQIIPGFRNSTASYTVSLLNPRIIADLRLAQHGLKVVERPFGNFLPTADGRYFKSGGSLEATQAELSKFSTRDAQVLPQYFAMLDEQANLLKQTLFDSPPNVKGALGFETMGDWATALRMLRRVNQLDWTGKRALLELFSGSAGTLLDRYFESDPIKAVLGWDSVVGAYASPYHPGTAYVLLHHCFGEVNGKAGQWGHAIGGMGAITQAMQKECELRGVRIELEAPVQRVVVEQGRAVGVELQDGRVFRAKQVAANVGPKLLYSRMVAASDLPTEFRAAVDGYKVGSGTFRMNVALSQLPRFKCLPHDGNSPAPHHGSGILLTPSLRYMEQAYASAREHGIAQKPIVEITIPSVLDDSLAPQGQHVAALFCQHFEPTLGAQWDARKPEAIKAIFGVCDQYIDNFSSSVLGYTALSPMDLERTFGLMGGDIFHGQLSLDQLYSARPMLGYSNYTTPVAGLYLCGSGAHPGGGVTGVPGHNAARQMLRD